jgi:hypothetical protein
MSTACVKIDDTCLCPESRDRRHLIGDTYLYMELRQTIEICDTVPNLDSIINEDILKSFWARYYKETEIGRA